jgi:hypothetical protein
MKLLIKCLEFCFGGAIFYISRVYRSLAQRSLPATRAGSDRFKELPDFRWKNNVCSRWRPRRRGKCPEQGTAA